MTRISSAFDAYINANILLVVAFTLWLVTRFILNRTGMRHAYGTQLRLLNAVFLAIVFSPFIAYAYKMMAGAGLLPGSLQLNLSDIMLAQYLNGSIAMSPTEMERLLNLRETLGAGLLQPAGWVQYTIVTLMLAGFLACLARCGIASFKLRRIITESYPWRRFGRVHLRLSDRALVPFSARGLRRRYIVVPANMLLRPQDMRIALAHEFQHLRQRDVEWEIGLELFKSLFFWNPVVHYWKRQIEQLRELSCDQKVLSRRRFEVQDYCDCLLRVCEDTLRRQPAQAIALPRVSLVQFDRRFFRPAGLTLLRRRVDSLFAAATDSERRRLSLLITGVLVATLAIATIAIQRPSGWSHDRLMLSSIINLERLETLNGRTTFSSW